MATLVPHARRLDAAALPANVFVGRQPIFDRRQQTVGYELLYRTSEDNRAVFDDANRASLITLVNAVLEVGLDRLVGPRARAFVNVTRDVLLSEYIDALPPRRVVLEILEDVPPDRDVVDRLRGLRRAGYFIALDDFVPGTGRDELIEHANLVKLDVLGKPADAIRAEADAVRPLCGRLLAEKVETIDQFELCKALGFVRFQGFFLARPNVVSGRRIAATRQAAMALLAKVHDPRVSLRELESAVVCDPAVSYKLLRYVNSAALGLRAKVVSIRHALVLVGMSRIRSWVSFLALAGIEDKPRELVVAAMVRGRTCELLARAAGKPNPDSYFAVGLLSLLDALMDRPMAELVDGLPLSEDVAGALLEESGELGAALACVRAYERDADTSWAERLGVPPERIRDAYLEAIAWTDDALARVG